LATSEIALVTRASSRSGELIGAKYRLEQLLGQGGMGSVYAARNTATGKRVAIKCLHREVANNSDAGLRFMREAKASARIRHPNVVDVYDIVSEDGALYLVMELLEGEPLSSRMAGPATVLPDFIRILVAAMRGVAAAHREGVIHRDIKPENIFLAREGDSGQLVPKVLDFGISKVSGTQDISLTATGAALGTALYMSSEQLHGARDLDARADVYAFGVILYQAVTGRAPFDAETLPVLLLRIMTETVTPVLELRPDAPPKLARLIERAMARQRDQRPSDLDAFIAELVPFAESSRYRHQLTRPFQLTPPPAAAPVSAGDAGSGHAAARARRALEPAAPPVSMQTPFAASTRPPRSSDTRSWLPPSIAAACGLGLAATSWWFLHGTQHTAGVHRVVPAATSGASANVDANASANANPAPVLTDKAHSRARESDGPGRSAVEVVSPSKPPALPGPQDTASNTHSETRRAGMEPQHAITRSKAPPPSPPAKPIPTKHPSPKPDCNPNFTLDDEGEKHYKPACF
jgi:serine/threonine-protein kinase